MVGKGSVNHNSRKFHAKNTEPERSHWNVEYCNEDIKDVYHELFDAALARYNEKQTRNDRRIEDYYEKILSGKQEKPFHEVILQIGNKDDMNAKTKDGQLAAQILDEYMKDFQKRNPALRVFSAHLHMDEATPHLHIDFVPFTTGSKRGLDTRVSLKQALATMGFKGGTRSETEWNQWVSSEKEQLTAVMEKHEIEWEKKGTHEKHLSVLDFEKKERAKEVAELEAEKINLEEKNAAIEEVSDKMLERLEEIESDVQSAQEVLDKTEQDAEKSKQKAQKYEKQFQRLDNISNNIRRYAGEFSRKAEEVLPDADFLESGKSYREKKALPVFRELKDLLYGLYLAYVKIREEVEKIQYRYDRLENSNKTLAKRNSELSEEVLGMREDLNGFNRLKRAVGVERANILIRAEQSRELAEITARKALKKRHDREAR